MSFICYLDENVKNNFHSFLILYYLNCTDSDGWLFTVTNQWMGKVNLTVMKQQIMKISTQQSIQIKKMKIMEA